MRVLNKDRAPDRLMVKINKSFSNEELPGGRGYLSFGENNDYPIIVENLINSSVTGASCSRVLSSFLAGEGFINDDINKVKIGGSIGGNPITVKDLINSITKQIAMHNGFYLHANRYIDGKISSLKNINFSKARLSLQDDLGYSSKIITSSDWSNVKKTLPTVFEIYQSNNKSFTDGLEGIEKHKGQIFYKYFNTAYDYPLSTFDSVLFDLATEDEMSVYRYNEAANSFMLRYLMRVSEPESKEDEEKLKEKAKELMGGEGDRLMIITDELDENGEIRENGAFRFEKVESNIQDTLFDSWETIITNRIRKAAYALPEILIQHEQSKLGTTSGVAITEAFNYYNAITRQPREDLYSAIIPLLQNFNNETLLNNPDWTIKELSL